MQRSDRESFAALVTDALAYYGKDATTFTLNVWWQACQPFALEQVSKALTAHATDAERGQFAPKVADIVRQLAGTATDRALVAWGKAHSAMSAVGAYRDVVFDDAAIHAVIEDLGGWSKVCRGEIAELPFLQKRFCDTYRAYVARGEFPYPRRLPGDRSPDSEYVRFGRPIPQPMLVGDRAACLAVFQGGGDAGKAQIAQAIDLVLPSVIQRLEGPAL